MQSTTPFSSLWRSPEELEEEEWQEEAEEWEEEEELEEEEWEEEAEVESCILILLVTS